MISESSSSYVLKMILQSEPMKVNEIVFSILENYLGKLHIVYMDNYYNSTKLTELLFENKIYPCGALKQNRGTDMKFEENKIKLEKEIYF